jgi:hypothetical protein
MPALLPALLPTLLLPPPLLCITASNQVGAASM